MCHNVPTSLGSAHDMFKIIAFLSFQRPKHTASKTSKLTDADLVSYIPASKLTNATYSGVAELQFGTGTWQKYWAVLHLQCLYIYQAKSAQSTVKTIVLPGYKISVAGQLVKKPFVIMLTHSCVLPTNLAASDQAEMDAWFSALDQASRLETQETERQGPISRELNEKPPSSSTETIEKENGASHDKVKETQNVPFEVSCYILYITFDLKSHSIVTIIKNHDQLLNDVLHCALYSKSLRSVCRQFML